MGTFRAKLRVGNPADPGKVYEPDVWVDTGAAFSWLSRSQLEAMGVSPLRRMQFRTIEGHIVERNVAPVFIGTDGFTGADMVVMAEAEDSEVMGAHSIEGLGLAADPVQKKLVPTVMLALAAQEVRLRGNVRKTGLIGPNQFNEFGEEEPWQRK